MNPIIFDENAERALLGAVLTNPNSFHMLDVDASDFYIVRHKWIWDAIASLGEFDIVTVQNKLHANGKLEEVQPAYITKLVIDTPFSTNAKQYAEIVKEKAKRRELLAVAMDLAKLAQGGENIEAEISPLIDRIANTASGKHGAEHWRRWLDELYNEVEDRMENPVDIWGMKTGFAKFDRITGGLQPGESLMMSGVPGVGKSIWAMQLAYQLAENNPGAIYSIEMKGKQVVRRAVSGIAKIETRKLKTGDMEQADWDKFVKYSGRLDMLPVYMSDAEGWTTASLRADLSRLKAQNKIKWFVLDYMYLLNDAPGMNETEKTGVISRALKNTCKALDLSGIIINSMNKEGMRSEGAPNQAMLRGSGQVSYDADMICYLTNCFEDDQTQFLGKDEKDKLRTFWFSKGRELANPKNYMHFIKHDGFPAFSEAMLE